MPTYALITPLPEIEWGLTILCVLRTILSQNIEIAVLMDRQLVIEPNPLLQKILSPMNLTMNKRAVHFMIDVQWIFRLRMSRLFNKDGNHRIKAKLHLTEKNPQSASIIEHVVRIAEHYIIGLCVIQTSVSCSAHATMLFLVILDLERIAVQKILAQINIGAIVTNDDSDFVKWHILLNRYAVK